MVEAGLLAALARTRSGDGTGEGRPAAAPPSGAPGDFARLVEGTSGGPGSGNRTADATAGASPSDDEGTSDPLGDRSEEDGAGVAGPEGSPDDPAAREPPRADAEPTGAGAWIVGVAPSQPAPRAQGEPTPRSAPEVPSAMARAVLAGLVPIPGSLGFSPAGERPSGTHGPATASAAPGEAGATAGALSCLGLETSDEPAAAVVPAGTGPLSDTDEAALGAGRPPVPSPATTIGWGASPDPGSNAGVGGDGPTTALAALRPQGTGPGPVPGGSRSVPIRGTEAGRPDRAESAGLKAAGLEARTAPRLARVAGSDAPAGPISQAPREAGGLSPALDGAAEPGRLHPRDSPPSPGDGVAGADTAPSDLAGHPAAGPGGAGVAPGPSAGASPRGLPVPAPPMPLAECAWAGAPNPARATLDSPELGPVTLVARAGPRGLDIRVTAADPGARRLLAAHAGELDAALRAEGLGAVRVVVGAPSADAEGRTASTEGDRPGPASGQGPIPAGARFGAPAAPPVGPALASPGILNGSGPHGSAAAAGPLRGAADHSPARHATAPVAEAAGPAMPDPPAPPTSRPPQFDVPQEGSQGGDQGASRPVPHPALGAEGSDSSGSPAASLGGPTAGSQGQEGRGQPPGSGPRPDAGAAPGAVDEPGGSPADASGRAGPPEGVPAGRLDLRI